MCIPTTLDEGCGTAGGTGHCLGRHRHRCRCRIHCRRCRTLRHRWRWRWALAVPPLLFLCRCIDWTREGRKGWKGRKQRRGRRPAGGGGGGGAGGPPPPPPPPPPPIVDCRPHHCPAPPPSISAWSLWMLNMTLRIIVRGILGGMGLPEIPTPTPGVETTLPPVAPSPCRSSSSSSQQCGLRPPPTASSPSPVKTSPSPSSTSSAAPLPLPPPTLPPSAFSASAKQCSLASHMCGGGLPIQARYYLSQSSLSLWRFHLARSS